ncbi:MAG: hypothetical protein FGM32_05790 [Candidatus Kapabacteria bacterium]|nr:hypothetical protein [Candidatus Kapabacteria bacterium]
MKHHQNHIRLHIWSMLMLCTALHGQTWSVLSPTLSHTIVINPQDPSKLYAGNWANQLFRSDDRGKSWRTVETGDINAQNFLTSVVVSRADTGVIIVGGFNFDGIKRSSDGGANWQRALADTVNNARMWYISEAIVEDPKRAGLLYAARGSTNNGIWRSQDNGVTWDSISSIPGQLTGRLCTMAIRPDSTNIIFVGAVGGQMFRSNDSGRTWDRVPVLDGKLTIRSDSEIPKIVFSPRDPMTGYAVVTIIIAQNIKNNGGLLKTTDGGASWNRIAFADTSLWAVDVRTTNDKDEVFVGGFRVDNTPTTIKGDGLMFRSPDGGATWSPVTDVPWGTNELGDTIRNCWVIRCDPTSRRVYLAASTGLYALDDVVSSDDDATESHGTLRLSTTLTDGMIEATSANWPNMPSSSWSLTDLRGRMVAHGRHDGPLPLRIDASLLTPGPYGLQLWNSMVSAGTIVVIDR